MAVGTVKEIEAVPGEDGQYRVDVATPPDCPDLAELNGRAGLGGGPVDQDAVRRPDRFTIDQGTEKTEDCLPHNQGLVELCTGHCGSALDDARLLDPLRKIISAAQLVEIRRTSLRDRRDEVK